MLHDNDLGSIVADYILRVDQSPCESGTKDCEDKEADIGSVVDCAGGFGVDVLSQRNLEESVWFHIASKKESTYQTANDSTQVKDHPEP